MGRSMGKITGVWEENGELAARIQCPAPGVPAPGQYVLASDPADRAAALPYRLFPTAIERDGFSAGPGLPRAWLPGSVLALNGPLGRGFALPEAARRAAFACLDGSPARLRPVITAAISRGCAAILFSGGLEGALDRWPNALEVAPLESLPEALGWADALALAASPGGLAGLRSLLGWGAGKRLPFPAQVLVDVPLPCGGMADCGACAVRARRGYRYACRDGPVFDLDELEW